MGLTSSVVRPEALATATMEPADEPATGVLSVRRGCNAGRCADNQIGYRLLGMEADYVYQYLGGLHHRRVSWIRSCFAIKSNLWCKLAIIPHQS